MWYNVREYSPGPRVVYAFIQPQPNQGYHDVFIMAYKDDEGVWRSTAGRPLNVLYWKYADGVLHPPDTYYFDPMKGWTKC